jgi:hypothetical protein
MAKKAQKAAIAEVIAAAAPAPAAIEQLELMPAMRPSLTDSQVERVETAIKADRRGRPPGAQNKATREMLEFVRKLCGDPLERRFRYAMHTPETLAIELGCTKLEAFDRLDRMWSELARYFYAQLGQVDASGNAVAPRLTMVFPGQSAPALGSDGSVRPPWMYIEQTQENQALSAPEQNVSHGDVSHGDD